MNETEARATLDALQRTRESLTAGPFSFHDWTRCTCGHLFVGAQGDCAIRRGDVRSPDPESAYASTVVAVAQLLSGDERRFSTHRRWYRPGSGARLAVRWVSDFTMSRARRRRDTVRRADAIAVVEEAIHRLQERIGVADVHERRLVA
jgi:hypothetical protein